MAYVTANLNLMAAAMGGGNSIWLYNGTDSHGTVEGADFFSDGAAKGMKVGDCVIVQKTTSTYESVLCYVKTVTAGGAATVAAAILA
jgi:hypothetical protein